jgi:hypothetical protein
MLIAAALGCTATEPAPQPHIEASPIAEPTRPPTPEVTATLEEVRAFFQLPELAYARAFAINVHTEYAYWEDLLVDDLGQLNPDRVPEHGALLSEAQLLELTHIVSSVDQDGVGPALCFYPHHAVALYDVQGKQLGELTFCFMCGRMKSSFNELGPDANFEALRGLLEDLVVPLALPLPGLPPAMARPIVKLEVENRLDQCVRTHGHPPLSFDVHVDERGVISQVVGLDGNLVVSTCLVKGLLGHTFQPAQADSVHHFEFAADDGRRLFNYERPL